MKKIMTVVGARPQLIKAAIVSQALRKLPGTQEIIVHTGQHYDENMSQIFLDELDIPKVDYQSEISTASHAKQTGEMMGSIEDVILAEKPDWLLIYGDTNSTLAAALAAAKLHIPIAHVEAGLRSYNRKMPEEINRLVADQLADVLFAPTKQAVLNLKKEGYSANKIIEVGDVMYDVALFFGKKSEKVSKILSKLQLKNKSYILSTIHRAENTNDQIKLFSIFTALEKVAESMQVVLPLHPRTRKSILKHYPKLLMQTNLTIIEPVGFLDMIMLEKNAALIVTDSGGVQKEAFFYQVPCVTVREETEWVELIELNWNRLVPPVDSDFIYQQIMNSLGTVGDADQHPYGVGNAAKLISEYLA